MSEKLHVLQRRLIIIALLECPCRIRAASSVARTRALEAYVRRSLRFVPFHIWSRFLRRSLAHVGHRALIMHLVGADRPNASYVLCRYVCIASVDLSRPSRREACLVLPRYGQLERRGDPNSSHRCLTHPPFVDHLSSASPASITSVRLGADWTTLGNGVGRERDDETTLPAIPRSSDAHLRAALHTLMLRKRGDDVGHPVHGTLRISFQPCASVPADRYRIQTCFSSGPDESPYVVTACT